MVCSDGDAEKRLLLNIYSIDCGIKTFYIKKPNNHGDTLYFAFVQICLNVPCSSQFTRKTVFSHSVFAGMFL